MHIYISYDDLDVEVKLRLRDQVVQKLREIAKKDGIEQLQRSWYNPQPRTWQEAYIRTYTINWRLWDSYEKRTPGADKPKSEYWQYWLDRHLEAEAETLLARAINDVEIDI